jgi:2'-5' RNA ligase
MRAFIAITLPPEIKDHLAKTIESLKPCSADAKWTPLNDLHITLKFFADVTEPQLEQIKKNLIDAAKEIKPFQVSLENLEFLPDDKKPRVFCASTSGQNEMASLVKSIDDIIIRLGFGQASTPFKAHITLARIKSLYNLAQLKDSLKSIKLEGDDFSVSGISIIKSALTSSGPVYEVIGEITFKSC